LGAAGKYILAHFALGITTDFGRLGQRMMDQKQESLLQTAFGPMLTCAQKMSAGLGLAALGLMATAVFPRAAQEGQKQRQIGLRGLQSAALFLKALLSGTPATIAHAATQIIFCLGRGLTMLMTCGAEKMERQKAIRALPKKMFWKSEHHWKVVVCLRRGMA
jgi:hypothetical protein